MTTDTQIDQPRDLFAEAGISASDNQPRDLFAEAGLTTQSQDPGILQRLVQDASTRQQTVQGMAQESPFLAGSKAVGQAAGFLANDLPSEAIKSGFNALPEHVQEGVKNAGKWAINTDLGQMGIHALKAGGDMWDSFKKVHPDMASVIGDAANAGSFLMAAPGAGVATKGAVTVAEKAAPIVADAAAATVDVAKATGGAIADASKGIADIPGNIAGKAISAVIPPVEEETANLAKKATEAYKIPLALNQVSDSPALANIQKVSQELPLSGTSSFRNKQLQALNSAVADSFGQTTSKINPIIIKKAYDDLGSQFNNLFSGRTIQITPQHIQDMYSVLDDAEHAVGSEPQKIIKKNIDYIIKNIPSAGKTPQEKLANIIANGGTVPGKKINQIRTKLQEVLRGSKDTNGEAADPYINKVLDKLLNASFENLPEETKQQYTNLKYQYKNLITITPVAAKAIRGNINPSLLEGAVMRTWGTKEYATGKAGALGDLAKISKTFLPHLGGSDTVQKAIYAGAGLSASGGAAALAGVPAAATGLAANRLYQAGNTSEKAVQKYLSKVPKK